MWHLAVAMVHFVKTFKRVLGVLTKCPIYAKWAQSPVDGYLTKYALMSIWPLKVTWLFDVNLLISKERFCADVSEQVFGGLEAAVGIVPTCSGSDTNTLGLEPWQQCNERRVPG